MHRVSLSTDLHGKFLLNTHRLSRRMSWLLIQCYSNFLTTVHETKLKPTKATLPWSALEGICLRPSIKLRKRLFSLIFHTIHTLIERRSLLRKEIWRVNAKHDLLTADYIVSANSFNSLATMALIVYGVKIAVVAEWNYFEYHIAENWERHFCIRAQ